MDEAEITKVIEKVLEKLGIGPAHITPEYYSIEDAATLVSMPEHLIKYAVMTGELVAFDLGTSGSPLYRIGRQSLMQWLKEHAVIPVPVSRHHLPKTQRPKKPGTNR